MGDYMNCYIEDYDLLMDDLSHNSNFLGCGAEGCAYQCGKNVIKVLYKDSFKELDAKIITSDDYKLDSYIFPEKLLINNNKYVGYIHKYFPNDIFSLHERELNDREIYNLFKAREKMIKETEILSRDKIFIIDLQSNILFDGEKLAAIDTLNYRKCDYDVAEDNIESIDYAILFSLSCCGDYFRTIPNMSFEENIKEYQKVLKR